MADNCLGLDPWALGPSWFPDPFSLESQALTKALQISLSDDSSASTPPLPPPPPLLPAASEPDFSTPRRTRNPHPSLPQSGRISKRKSRASRRATTTFITADPANFRAMVQQVTGVRFADGGPSIEPVFKPEPQRASFGFGFGSQVCLPTLDTSAFLLDRDGVVGFGQTGPECSGEPGVVETGFDFEPVQSFPTLESWGVM